MTRVWSGSEAFKSPNAYVVGNSMVKVARLVVPAGETMRLTERGVSLAVLKLVMLPAVAVGAIATPIGVVPVFTISRYM